MAQVSSLWNATQARCLCHGGPLCCPSAPTSGTKRQGERFDAGLGAGLVDSLQHRCRILSRAPWRFRVLSASEGLQRHRPPGSWGHRLCFSGFCPAATSSSHRSSIPRPSGVRRAGTSPRLKPRDDLVRQDKAVPNPGPRPLLSLIPAGLPAILILESSIALPAGGTRAAS